MFIEELEIAQDHLNIYCDSQSNVHLAKNQVYHRRTKPIDVCFHFVLEVINDRKILLPR